MTRRGRARLLSTIVGVALVATVGAGAAVAADAPMHTLLLRRVDAVNAAKTKVVFTYDGPAQDVDGLTATFEGNPLDVKAQPAGTNGEPLGLVLMVDSSGSTDTSGLLTETRKAVPALLDGLPAGTEVAVVTAGRDATRVQRFTLNHQQITTPLATITPQGDGALYEGVARAASLLRDRPELVPEVLLITDGNQERPNQATILSAQGALADVGAVLDVVAVKSPSLDGGPRSLAEGSAGTYLESEHATDIGADFTTLLQRFTGNYSFSFPAPDDPGVRDLTLSAGGASSLHSFVMGAVSTGSRALAYDRAPGSSGLLPALQNNLGMLLGVLLAIIAAGLAAFALLSSAFRDQGMLASLRDYDEGRTTEVVADEGMAQTQLIQRAVSLTQQFAQRQGVLTKVEGALERANLPLRADEALFFYAAAVVTACLLATVITQSLFNGLFLFLFLAAGGPAVLNILATRRKRRFESQLPDTLQLLSGTLRAGYSMMQGVEAVSQEVEDPMGRELRRVVTEARLGRPLEDSLDAIGDRMDSNDFKWATMAIRIQREVGGNLSELLMTVADTMTHRERLRRDVNTLTAEGRMSAYVLGALPFGVGFAMYGINPDYMTALFDSGLGKALLVASALLMSAGFAWMLKIIKIEV